MPTPSSSRSSRTIRGPLIELPIDAFILSPGSTTKPPPSSIKRPMEPGTHVLYSPAKRRILNEEGLFTAKSPLSTSIQPTSTVGAPSGLAKTPQQGMARFSDALIGSDSPARKLDFGTPKNAVAGEKTPLRESEGQRSRRLAPSPEIKSGPHSQLKDLEREDYGFPASSSQSHSQPPQSQSQSQSLPSSYGPWTQHQRHLQFSPVPRELPLPPDPQSAHYPGFTIYQDLHIFLPTLTLASPASTPTTSSTLAPLDNHFDVDSDTESESIDARELVKENLPPRRRSRKAATAPLPEKAQLFSPPSTKSLSVPATPPRELMSKEKETLTPRRPSIFGVASGTGMARVQHTPSKEERKAMRRILEEEVDGE